MERLVKSIRLDFGFCAKTSGLITWLVYPIRESLSLTHSIHRNCPFTDPTTVIRIRKNDEITKTRTQDREDLAVHQVRQRQVHQYKMNVSNREKNKHVSRDRNECRKCGCNHMDRTCPLRGQICRNCQKVGYFLKKSAEKKIQYISHKRHKKRWKRLLQSICCRHSKESVYGYYT